MQFYIGSLVDELMAVLWDVMHFSFISHKYSQTSEFNERVKHTLQYESEIDLLGNTLLTTQTTDTHMLELSG